MQRKWAALPLLLLVAGPGGQSFGEANVNADCPIFPIPKVYRDSGKAARLAKPDGAAIVIGSKATEPERYAAERLQFQINRLAGRKVPIATEESIPKSAKQIFLLGQRSTNALLDRLCGKNKIDLSEESPGHDGFVMETFKDGKRQIVVVGGSNARGALYGQYALYDLMRKEKEEVVFPIVSIRDWPGIRWRSWWWDDPRVYLRPGTLDAYARARINMTQIENHPPNVCTPENMDEYRAIMQEIHRRGMFAYGMVTCAVADNEHDEVLEACRELVDVGVDGLYMRFDDAGPGSNPAALVKRILAFAAEHGMTGEKVALLPPGGSYENPNTAFNRMVSDIEGFKDIQWFFTSAPSKRLGDLTRSLGLSVKPAWWHNWPMEDIGFPVDPQGKDWWFYYYRVLLPLKHGWGEPTFEDLRDAPQYINIASVPVRSKPEYLTAELGHWAWDPKTFDWSKFRLAAYGYVFGRSQAEAARGFDDALIELRKLFRHRWRNWYEHGWALIDRNDKGKALEIVGRAEALLGEIRKRALAETSLDPDRCQEGYLEPMDRAVRFARKQASVEFPEYVVAPKVQDRNAKAEQILGDTMSDWLMQGETEKAKAYLADVAKKMEPLFGPFEEEMKDSQFTKEYVEQWRKMLDFDYWREHVDQRIGQIVVDVRRDGKGMVTIETNAKEAQLLYTFDGTAPGGSAERYREPFPLEGQGVIKAIAYFPASGIASKVRERHFGIPKGKWKVLFVDSEEPPNEGAALAIDDDPNTIWITEWQLKEPKHPHEIRIDLGEPAEIEGFGYLPRKGNPNGTIEDYEFYVSPNGSDWGAPAAKGEFTYPEEIGYRRVSFEKSVSGRYIRLVALSEKNGRPWTSAAEIDVFGKE